MARVTLESVTKSFGPVKAVNDINMEVEDGEFIALLGASGCGKTTLLRLLAGFEPVTQGVIAFDGEPVSSKGRHLPPEKRRVGMVFQAYALWPHMSVFENVAFSLRVRGITNKQRAERVSEALDTVGMTDLAERKPSDLSGGQRQRVALARCLAMEPRLVLLDEPLANLDVNLRESMQNEFRRFHRKTKSTMVYVTHDQAEAMALADRIAVMDKGRIVQIGAPREIYFNPAERCVAEFIGVFNQVRAKSDVSGLVLAEDNTIPLHALTNGNKNKHGDVELFFRPEDAHICDNGSLTGKVTSSVFLGDKVRVHVLLSDGQMVKVDAPGKHLYEEGASVGIELESESAMVLS